MFLMYNYIDRLTSDVVRRDVVVDKYTNGARLTSDVVSGNVVVDPVQSVGAIVSVAREQRCAVKAPLHCLTAPRQSEL